MERDTRTALLLAAAFLVLWIVYGQLSPGTYDDDDVTHFFIARECLDEPSLLISLWGRPLFTLLYALPAQIGYGAVEAFTAVIMAATLLLTWLIARRLELRPAWVAMLLTAWQPLFFKLGFSSLVEPIGALTLTAAVYAFLTRRDLLTATLAGLLPLTRFELVVLVPFLLLPIWRRRQWPTFALAAAPLLLWNFGGWFFHGDPIWLFNQIAHNEFGRSFAGARPLLHYVQAMPFVTGGAVLTTLALGLASPWRGGVPGRDLIRWMLITFVVVLSLLAWQAHDFGGSVGYLRHLVSVGPLIGLVGAMGLARWMEADAKNVPLRAALIIAAVGATAACVFRAYHTIFEHPVNRGVEPWLATAAAVAAAVLLSLWRREKWLPIGVAAVAGASTLISEPPIPLDVERGGVRDIVTFIERNAPGRRVAVNHPWFFFLSGGDRRDALQYPRLTHETLERLRPGSFVVWENHYSARLTGDVKLDHFSQHPERYLPRAKDSLDRTALDGTVTSQFVYVIFEVVAPDDPRLGAALSTGAVRPRGEGAK